MKWLDVAGAPGSGKSTLCDHFFGPHAIQIEDRLPPAEWHDFINEVSRLFHLIRDHWSFGAAVRMNNRSFRKVSTVARMNGDGPYIQTCLAQRGLGFGWRLIDLKKDPNELRHFFRLMPVSIGVAFTKCPPEIVAERNKGREQIKATAHENRAFMVPLMLPAIEIAKEVLNERGVPVVEIDTTQPIEDARRQLLEFAHIEPFDPEAHGPRCQVEVLSKPPFWAR